jgi:hypothetical protein
VIHQLKDKLIEDGRNKHNNHQVAVQDKGFDLPDEPECPVLTRFADRPCEAW